MQEEKKKILVKSLKYLKDYHEDIFLDMFSESNEIVNEEQIFEKHKETILNDTLLKHYFNEIYDVLYAKYELNSNKKIELMSDAKSFSYELINKLKTQKEIDLERSEDEKELTASESKKKQKLGTEDDHKITSTEKLKKLLQDRVSRFLEENPSNKEIQKLIDFFESRTNELAESPKSYTQPQETFKLLKKKDPQVQSSS